MNFLTELLILTDWKSESYNLILVIINQLTKIVYYKPIKIITNTLGLTKVKIDVVVRHYRLLDSIITN